MRDALKVGAVWKQLILAALVFIKMKILVTAFLLCVCVDVYAHILLAATAKSLQLCLTLCNPIDGSPPGSPVPGILQARTLEWVAIPSPMHESEKWKWSQSVWLLATPWTINHQALLFMGFSRQEYWSGLPFPSPGDLPNPICLHCRQILYQLSLLESLVWIWEML